MAKRFFVQLASVYKAQDVAGWLMSEKLDGMRAFWDGGVTRGIPCSEVPWANTIKDSIRVTPPISTGLWSRGGKMIPAPDWWLNRLPNEPVDGELYMGPGMFQQVMSTCKAADRDWSDVAYCVYGMPSTKAQFAPGEICFNAKDKIFFECYPYKIFEGHKLGQFPDIGNDVVHTVPQVRLSSKPAEQIADRMTEVMNAGGEGLMLSQGGWEPHRSKKLLKVKTFNEGEGTVVGYVWGRETDRGSKLAGLMGQLRVMFNGQEFGLSGFTEAERVLTDAVWDPGKTVIGATSLQFPIGSEVRFKYRELTDDGLPKEARYWR